ncbi:MAG: ABC transporter ATP-binding protein [Nitrospinaceae bacterium]|nr:MAG: ABC transporter ATP-binding protein [Nitrospinaceae bacterium]
MGRIDVKNLCMEYNQKRVLDRLDLEVLHGEFLVVLGESGCGKSTLLNLIAGLREPFSGQILFDQRDVTRLDVQSRNVAFVFQDYALYPHMTVEQNIRFPLENLKLNRREIDHKCDGILTRLRLNDFRNQYPNQLSGGQKQRVAIGRAMVRDPFVFLFDEPLSSLDPHLRDHLRLELKQLHKELKKTFIYVTHDQLSAMVLGDRVAFMDDGKIQQIGPPLQLYRSPANIRIARFFGFPPVNVLTATDFERLSGKPAPDSKMKFCIRPENLECRADSKGCFEVQWIQQMGAANFVYISVGKQTICGLGKGSLHKNQKVSCNFKSENLMIF